MKNARRAPCYANVCDPFLSISISIVKCHASCHIIISEESSSKQNMKIIHDHERASETKNVYSYIDEIMIQISQKEAHHHL